MKKKYLALLTALLMVVSLVGCNTQGIALLKEFETASKWAATEQTGSLEMTMTAMGETLKLAATYEAFTSTEDLQMEMTLTPKTLEISGAKLDLTKGTYQFSPVKIYMDGLKIYMSSSYIKDLCRLQGEDASMILTGDEAYLAFDLASGGAMDLEALTKSNTANLELYKDLKTGVSIKQDGRKYTMDLSGEQMVDVVFEMVNTAFDSQEPLLRETYKAMGFDDAMIDELLVQVKAVYNEDTKAQIKPFVKESKAQVIFNFSDAKYTSDYQLDVEVNALGEKISLNMDIQDEVKKVSKKTISFPTSVKVYTMEDLMNIGMSMTSPEMALVEVSLDEVKVEGAQAFVPLRKTLEAVGVTKMSYDKSTQMVTLPEVGIRVPVVVYNGTSYVDVEVLAGLGVQVEIMPARELLQ